MVKKYIEYYSNYGPVKRAGVGCGHCHILPAPSPTLPPARTEPPQQERREPSGQRGAKPRTGEGVSHLPGLSCLWSP